MIRVCIVASSPFARSGLEGLLAAREFKVVGYAADLSALEEHLEDLEPDAIIVDATGENSSALLDALRDSELASESNLLVLLDQAPPGWPAEALRAGVRAILPGNVSGEQLAAALHAAVAGLITVHPAEVATTFQSNAISSAPGTELAEPLTPREREVLQMLASGLLNKEIAAKLSISEHTVKFHVASILGKLGASTRTEAVSLGIRRGLVLL
ncbi:MAG TPA: response regulator transcription factor [Candidatus Acidoferrum sp.]|nr:response regulator transcription factor [Candidatus Acidoferrum sp.]